MSDITEGLKQDGWTEPLDESPVETPDGWHYGGVEHTGGNIWCRIWRDYESVEELEAGETAHEVIYGSQFDGVGVERYTAPENGRLEFDELVTQRDSDEQTDERCAEIATELMRQAAGEQPEVGDTFAFNYYDERKGERVSRSGEVVKTYDSGGLAVEVSSIETLHLFPDGGRVRIPSWARKYPTGLKVGSGWRAEISTEGN